MCEAVRASCALHAWGAGTTSIRRHVAALSELFRLDSNFLTDSLLLPGVTRWSSQLDADQRIGAEADFAASWGGSFALIAPVWSFPTHLHSRQLWSRCLATARKALDDARPARFVLVLPAEFLTDSMLRRYGATLVAKSHFSHPNGVLALRVAVLDNARARSISPLFIPDMQGGLSPGLFAATSNFGGPPGAAPNPTPLRHPHPGQLPPHRLPVPWPGKGAATDNPSARSDPELPAYTASLGALAPGLAESIVSTLAGDCEVRKKRVRAAWSRHAPSLRLRLLKFSFRRYTSSHRCRYASWAAGASGWLASGSADDLALRIHEQRRAAEARSFDRRTNLAAAARQASARTEHVARHLGLSPAEYRRRFGQPRRNFPIPPEHQHLLSDFQQFVSEAPARARRSARPRPQYSDEYVLAADEPLFAEQLPHDRVDPTALLLRRLVQRTRTNIPLLKTSSGY